MNPTCVGSRNCSKPEADLLSDAPRERLAVGGQVVDRHFRVTISAYREWIECRPES
jgi:hypothetical protein